MRELRVLSHFDQPTLGEHLGVFGRSPSAPGLERLVLMMDEVGDEVLPRMRSWRKPALEELVLREFSMRDTDTLTDLLVSGALPGLRRVVLFVGQGHPMIGQDPEMDRERDRMYSEREVAPRLVRLTGARQQDHAFDRLVRAASARSVALYSELSLRH